MGWDWLGENWIPFEEPWTQIQIRSGRPDGICANTVLARGEFRSGDHWLRYGDHILKQGSDCWCMQHLPGGET